MKNLMIRHEQPKDYRAVEEQTREAFWNVYEQGADEHYLVHQLRAHPDYLPELSFIAELNGEIAGSIFFSKSYIVDEKGDRHQTVTYGPVSVLPKFQGKGIGRALIEHAIQAAKKAGYPAIIIDGYLDLYAHFGFRHAKDFGIRNAQGRYPVGQLALELTPGALKHLSGRAVESSVFEVDEKAAAAYDAQFPPKEKQVMPSQKRFEETAAAFL